MRKVLLILFAAAATVPAQHPNYDDDVKPIFRRYCLGCHNGAEMRSGLNLEAYDGLMKGGSSGDAVKPGRASGSLLYQAVAHEGDGVPRMPQGGAKIPDAAIGTIRDWIANGVLENATGKPKGPVNSTANFTGSTLNKPSGAPAFPNALAPFHPAEPRRAHPVTALATSPWAPLLAVAGHERVYLYNTDSKAILGELPFPEGIPYVLRFSRDGSKLLVGGGKGVETGKVALFDVKTGQRTATIGAEFDIVLAADLSPDGKMVALGGPAKIVKVYNVGDPRPVYQIKKHMDWITAIEFSPDGTKLATGDRSGGLFLWEAASGGIIVALAEHKDSIRALSWRGDAALLASGSEDGELVIWNAADGFPAATAQNAHAPKPAPGTFGKPPNGVLSLQFTPDGRVVSVGRDNTVKTWSANAKVMATSKIFDSLLLSVAASFDNKTIVVGDYLGNVTLWDGMQFSSLSSKPSAGQGQIAAH